MPGEIFRDFTGSMHNALPEGCRLCHVGAKLVLFVTGICGRNCFYCPVSEERKELDYAYANERKVGSDDDVLEEALLMDSLGTGITGGEPLARLDRVLHYLGLLKSRFGPSHHVHLYTCTAPSPQVLRQLRAAGLDEIRLHPPVDRWDDFYGSEYHRALKDALAIGLSAGVEIPALKPVPAIVRAVSDAGGFLNLNELEFSDTNHEGLKSQGHRLRDGRSNSAAGSETVAHEIVLNSIANTRYCSSRFKDAVQLRERLKRTAVRVARPFDEITADGTLVYGEIRGDVPNLSAILENLDVPRDLYRCDGGVIEIAWWVLDDLKEELTGAEKSIVERYPLKDGLVVERIPL